MVYSSSLNTCSSTPIKMPLISRRRPLMKLSSSPVTTVDAQGTAYLCFPDNHSWFQGNISTDDESNYSLYGELVTVSAEEKAAAAATFAQKISKLSLLSESDEENNNTGDVDNSDNSSEEELVPEDYYRVTMIDHFSGQKHILPRIFVRQLEDSTSSGTSSLTPGCLFTSQHGEVTFQVENVYKGQKADIMIHRYLGSGSLLGTKCLLYSCQINILFDDTIEMGKNWSL